MNGFQQHNLKHTSASQVNLWASSPCAWVAKYLYGHKDTYGVPAQIGVLVEEVVAKTLCGGSFNGDVADAEKTFMTNNALNTNEKEVSRVCDIRLMAELALGELRQYGKPEFIEGSQKKITINCTGDNWTIPIIGYLDFYYPQHNLIVDLKTTSRMPSRMSIPHKRQAAIYNKAHEDFDVKFLYVTKNKAKWLQNDYVDETLTEVKSILTRQERFLRLGDKELLRSVVHVDPYAFFWRGNESLRKEMYNV